KRMGLGGERLTGIFERERVQYVLIPYAGKRLQGNIEILLSQLPEQLAIELGIDNVELQESFQKMFAKSQIKALEPHEALPVPENSPGDELSPEETMDPYAFYRINDRQFVSLQDQLITFDELVRVAKKKGYTYRAIYRATGGPKMRYILPSQLWRPYVYRKKRYFLKEVLHYLHESDKTYQNPGVVQRNRRERAYIRRGVQNPHLFDGYYEKEKNLE